MLATHDYKADGYGYCRASGCGLPERNWRHNNKPAVEPTEDRTEPRHPADADGQGVIPFPRTRSGRRTRATPRRTVRSR
jgi:hypothetical protein